MTSPDSPHPHCIIIGAGITGGALACAGAQRGVQVDLVDKGNFETPPPEDGKSFALSPSSKKLFEEIGLWETLTEITSITTIHTSDGMSNLGLDYEEADLDQGPLGYVVDSALLKTKLMERLHAYPNIRLHGNTAITSIERNEHRVSVQTEQGDTLEAPLCIASDGRFSQTRARANIPLREWNYNQTAIVCTLAHSLPHQNQAWEHFLPAGPLAFVPREGNVSGLVWSLETPKAAHLLKLSPEEFVEDVRRAFGPALGDLTLASERWSYPLGVCLPKRVIDRRLVLVGDAAHTFHPVAGQGLNVGLRDVAALAQTLGEAASLGLDLGASYLLEKYQRQRQLDVLSMTYGTDGLVRVFSTQSPLMARVRSFGFGLVRNIPPLKRLMIRHARGTV